PMRLRYVIVIVLVAGSLSGCTWLKDQWPWRRKEVPVTPPSDVTTRSAEPALAVPQPDASQDPPRRLAPQRREQERPARPPGEHDEPMPLTELLAETRPASQPAKPAPTTKPAATRDVKPPVSARTEGVSARKTPVEPEVVVAFVLYVNDRFITVDDVLDGAAGGLTDISKNLPEKAYRLRAREAVQQEVRRRVSQLLVLVEAERRLPDEQTRQIDEQMERLLQRMIANAGGSRSKLEQTYARQGKSLATVLRKRREDLTVQLYLRMRFMPAISVNRSMLWDYYQKNRAEFSWAKKVQMQLITVPFKAFLPGGRGEPSDLELQAAKAKTIQQITEAQKALRAGEDFDEVAKRLSRGIKAAEGGLWPMMPAGNFRKTEVEAAAFKLRQGQVSEIIETETGCHIVKAVRVEPGKTMSFEEAQGEIEEKLRAAQFDRLTVEYFGRLFESARILRAKEFMDAAVDQAVREYWRR
ncbi:MAG: peptidylprolyl isomerase, partial [Phycisphaerae bacterium]|nr:peptidylprolyl isomerase [Phycisphaerae bacterium]